MLYANEKTYPCSLYCYGMQGYAHGRGVLTALVSALEKVLSAQSILKGGHTMSQSTKGGL